MHWKEIHHVRVANFGAQICGKLTIRMRGGIEKIRTQQNVDLIIERRDIYRNSERIEGLLV